MTVGQEHPATPALRGFDKLHGLPQGGGGDPRANASNVLCQDRGNIIKNIIKKQHQPYTIIAIDRWIYGYMDGWIWIWIYGYGYG